MTDRTGGFGPVARSAHPRLALLTVVGALLGLVGLVLFLTAGSGGHDFGTGGLRIGVLGVIVLAFAVSGYLAFAVFERGFD